MKPAISKRKSNTIICVARSCIFCSQAVALAVALLSFENVTEEEDWSMV